MHTMSPNPQNDTLRTLTSEMEPVYVVINVISKVIIMYLCFQIPLLVQIVFCVFVSSNPQVKSCYFGYCVLLCRCFVFTCKNNAMIEQTTI